MPDRRSFFGFAEASRGPRRGCWLACALTVSLAAGMQAGGDAGATIRATVEVIAQYPDAPSAPVCRWSSNIASNRTAVWWIAWPTGETPTPGLPRAPVTCGEGPPPAVSVASAPNPRVVLVSATAIVMAYRTPTLEIRISSAPGATTSPTASRERDVPRRMFLLDGFDDALYALEDTLPAGAASPRSGEIYLRVSATLNQAPAVEYGALTVVSDVESGEVLLDGGAVGQLDSSRMLVLRNVLAGEHEIRVRGRSGEDYGRWVLVRGRRTILVDLDPSPSPAVRGARLAPAGRNSAGFEEHRRLRDDAVVVKIPAGEFLMGNPAAERQPPEHRVYVSEFLIDKTEVTWGQYKKFAAETATPLPPFEPYWGIRDDHPVSFVTWDEAAAYCEWAGGRLPTEAEWEKASRGTDERMFPWGNEPPDPDRAVFRRSWGHHVATDPAGAHPSGASPYGVLDMGGSHWEWCADWYEETYYASSPTRDPRGPRRGESHVVRGGSWDSRPTVLSCSVRSWGHGGYREGDFGFRCAMDSPR